MSVSMASGQAVGTSAARRSRLNRRGRFLPPPHPTPCPALTWRNGARQNLAKVTIATILVILPVFPRTVPVQQLEDDLHLQRDLWERHLPGDKVMRTSTSRYPWRAAHNCHNHQGRLNSMYANPLWRWVKLSTFYYWWNQESLSLGGSGPIVRQTAVKTKKAGKWLATAT